MPAPQRKHPPSRKWIKEREENNVGEISKVGKNGDAKTQVGKLNVLENDMRFLF